MSLFVRTDVDIRGDAYDHMTICVVAACVFLASTKYIEGWPLLAIAPLLSPMPIASPIPGKRSAPEVELVLKHASFVHCDVKGRRTIL